MYVKKRAFTTLHDLEKYFNADVIFYYGALAESIEKSFRDFIEELKFDKGSHETLCIVLNTPGGSVEAVAAGTIFCLSGDKIFMDYSSSLGPIDPQVFNGANWVPALG